MANHIFCFQDQNEPSVMKRRAKQVNRLRHNPNAQKLLVMGKNANTDAANQFADYVGNCDDRLQLKTSFTIGRMATFLKSIEIDTTLLMGMGGEIRAIAYSTVGVHGGAMYDIIRGVNMEGIHIHPKRERLTTIPRGDVFYGEQVKSPPILHWIKTSQVEAILDELADRPEYVSYDFRLKGRRLPTPMHLPIRKDPEGENFIDTQDLLEHLAFSFYKRCPGYVKTLFQAFEECEGNPSCSRRIRVNSIKGSCVSPHRLPQ